MPRGVEPGLPPPPPFGALVWAVTQKAPARSRAPGGGVRPGARRAAGRWGASRRAEPGAGVQAPTPRSPRPPRSPPRASSRAGGGRAGTTPRCYRRRRRLRLCRERPSPLQREVGDFRFVSLLCPSRVGGCERGAEGWIPSPPLLPRPEPGKRGRGAATWCVGGLLLGSGLGWRAARVPGRGVRCTAGRSRGAGEGGSLELRFSRALAELGWRLGRGSGAVGGSAESSDAPWSSSPRERVSCPRRARPVPAPRAPRRVHVRARAPAAPPPRTHPGQCPSKPPVEQGSHPQKLPSRATPRPRDPCREERELWRARCWGSFVRTHVPGALAPGRAAAGQSRLDAWDAAREAAVPDPA